MSQMPIRTVNVRLLGNSSVQFLWSQLELGVFFQMFSGQKAISFSRRVKLSYGLMEHFSSFGRGVGSSLQKRGLRKLVETVQNLDTIK